MGGLMTDHEKQVKMKEIEDRVELLQYCLFDTDEVRELIKQMYDEWNRIRKS